ncbi:MAG TPA: CheR family methyltransferase, partial [Rubrivivax sp.]|nr:CheR family methyltransferase [Rubrivivax sp.]
PADIAGALKVALPRNGDEASRDEEALRDVMQLLRTRTQHDFRSYKRATVLRRLERRMQVTATTSLESYRDYLREHPQETPALLQDMLISVTNFFRDRRAFEALERDVLPDLIARLPPEQPFRAWVPGCATGEEAYSLAMLVQEALQNRPEAAFQIFATDIDDRALVKGRSGLYPGSVAGDVTPTRLRQFMQSDGNHCRVVKSLRDHVLFAHHNVLRDPPFSRLDLVACRNLLIYLDRDAQAAVLQTFRFALKPGGVLFLGSAESVEVVADLFEPIDKQHRLYRPNVNAHWHRSPGPLQTPLTPRPHVPPAVPLAVERNPPPFAKWHERALRQLMPASVLLDSDHNILHVSEDAGAFLQPQVGVPSRSMVNNVQPALRLELRAALFKAGQTGEPVETSALRRKDDGTQAIVHMVVRPYADADALVPTVLVTFEEMGHVEPGAPASQPDPGTMAVVGELEAEATRLRERLRETLEQAETSTEELKSSNEELQALNEELRSATEELETGKEELQSVNEELVTVNYELTGRVEEAGRINDDLQNFIASTDIATVFVDGALRVKRFTPRAGELFNLIASDVGRPLLDITHRLHYDELTRDAEAAFQNLRPVEREVRSDDGRVFLSRFLPYRTSGDRIQGVVLTFVDITALRAAEQSAREKDEKLLVALESTKEFAIAVIDPEGLVLHWNVGAERVFGWRADEIVGRPLDWVFTEEDRLAGVPQAERRTAAERGQAEDERWHLRKDGTRFYCSGVMTPFDNGRHTGFAKICRDITGSKHSELAREALLKEEQTGRRRAQAAIEAKDEFLAIMSHELKHPLNLISINAQLLARLPQLRAVEPAVRAVQTIERTLAAQAKIVDDLLDLSRARTGKLTLQMAPVDWAATVRSIVEAVRLDAQAKGVELSLKGADGPLSTLFDQARAEQVVWNLLSNALKFTPSGGSIRVALEMEAKWLRLTVTDTGKGIDLSYLGKVFDMFSQEVSVERRREGGLGVGLALVRELVTAHGGRVSAASPGPGKGATFTVWVPRGGDGFAEPAQEEPQSHSVLNGLRVLLVDDSLDTILALGMLIRLSGAIVSTASSGAEALRELGESAFDVLVSDVSMPDMSGLDLIRAVRALPGGSGLVAVACSGFSRQLDAQRALAAGFDAQLPKPLSLGDLESTVERLRAARRPGTS